jgi:preprotein translocase subunit SecA
MEDLRKSIVLRIYSQKDPLVEYKAEAYRFFEELMNQVRLQICTGLFRRASNLEAFENMLSLLSRTAQAVGPGDAPAQGRTTVTAGGSAATAGSEPEIQLPKVTIRRETAKVGRNDPCPCGSRKKYKHCRGA